MAGQSQGQPSGEERHLVLGGASAVDGPQIWALLQLLQMVCDRERLEETVVSIGSYGRGD